VIIIVIIECQDKYTPKVIIDVDRCVGCYMCQRACALAKCISINPLTNLAEVVEPNDCTGCMACERACPYNCIYVINYIDPAIRAKVTISRVKRYMKSPVITASGHETVVEGAKIMIRHNIASIVINGTRIVTETDILTSPSLDAKLSDVSKEAICIDKLCNMEKALEVMISYNISHLPVTSSGNVVGMISLRDVLRAYSISSVVNYGSQSFIKIDTHVKLKEIGEKVDVIEEDIVLRDAVDLMIKKGRKALVVRNQGRLGIFTFRDAVRMLAEGKGFEDPIEGRFEVKVFNPEDSLTSIIPWVIEKNHRHVVASDGQQVYLISVKDVVGKTVWVSKTTR